MNENEKNKMNIALITYHRMKKGISLENLSNDLHISKGFLSEILNGKKKIKEDFFKQAMLSMNINYLYDEEPFNLLKEYIIEIYKAFVVSNLKKAKRITELAQQSEKTNHNQAYCIFYYRLLSLLEMILFRENVIDDKLFMTIEYLLPSLDSYFQVIFFDLRLINCIRSSNIVLGKKCASEALKISNRVNIKNIDSTIKYHLSQLVVFIEPQNSLDILSKTKNDFSEANNYPRLIYCDNLIAVALTNLGRFEEADKILKNIIAIHNNFTDNQIIESARNNIIWNYIQAQHFSLAIDAIGDYKQSVFSYYLPYCYFSLGNYRECKKSIDMIHSFNKIDSDNLSIINLIEQSVYERNKTFDKEIKKLIKRFNKKNVALLKIVLQIGIFHYEKTKNINSLAKMQKDLLTVFNNQSLL